MRQGRWLYWIWPLLCLAQAQQSALKPASPEAGRIALWWWIMLAIAGVVFAVVLILLLLGVFRGYTRAFSERGLFSFVVIAGAAVPAVVLVTLMLVNIFSERAAAAAVHAPKLNIEVIGHRWWWEVRYPDQNITTANEVHIPVGQPVKLLLTSDDVIHSFWVPELNGKRDLIPGQTNALVIQADTPGTYRGQCAEFCGLEHAKMALQVIAEQSEAFDAWSKAQAAPATAPTSAFALQGEQVFLGSACVYCHTIKGTNASSRFGPDLTHIASRTTLGAGTLKNNRGNLSGWIINSQAVKPGNKMPPMYLSAQDLQALLAYLEGLQ